METPQVHEKTPSETVNETFDKLGDYFHGKPVSDGDGSENQLKELLSHIPREGWKELSISDPTQNKDANLVASYILEEKSELNGKTEITVRTVSFYSKGHIKYEFWQHDFADKSKTLNHPETIIRRMSTRVEDDVLHIETVSGKDFEFQTVFEHNMKQSQKGIDLLPQNS